MEKVAVEQLIAHPHFYILCSLDSRKNIPLTRPAAFSLRTLKANLDQGGVVGAVFLDLRKPFDTVNHNQLLHILGN